MREGNDFPLRRAAPVLLALVAVVLLASLAQADGTQVTYDDDVELWGTITDVSITARGNVTVPANRTLELRHVELVFDPGTEPLCLRGLGNSTIIITDGDGDPDTTGDATTICALDGKYYIEMQNGARFVANRSFIKGQGRLWSGAPPLIASTIKADIITVDNTQFLDLEGTLDLRGSLLFNQSINGSLFEGSYDGVMLSGAVTIVTESTFRDGFSGLAVYSRTRNIVEDCVFDTCTRGLYGKGTNEVTNCSFTDCSEYGYWMLVENASLTGCRFENCAVGVWTRTYGTMALEDCVLMGCRLGLNCTNPTSLSLTNVTIRECEAAMVSDNHVNLTLRECLVKNCITGFCLNSSRGKEVVLDSEFVHVEGSAVVQQVQRTINLTSRLENCTFEDVGLGLEQRSDILNGVYIIGTVALNNTLRDIGVGLRLLCAELQLMGNSFEGGAGHTKGVGVEVHEVNVEWGYQGFNISGNSYRDLSVGLWMRSEPLPNHRNSIMTNETFTLCECGASLESLERVTIALCRFEGCTLSLNLTGLFLTDVEELTFNGSVDGIRAVDCDTTRYHNITGKEVTGLLMDERSMRGSILLIDGNRTYRNINLRLAGTVMVSGSLTLEGCNVTLTDRHPGDGCIVILRGGALTLNGTSLCGTEASPFSLECSRGVEVRILRSTVEWLGHPVLRHELQGMSLEDGSLVIRGSTLRHCYGGIVLVSSRATLDGSAVNSSKTALDATGSVVVVTGSELGSSIADGCRLEASELAISGSTVSGSFWGVIANGSTVTGDDVRISSGSSCLGLDDSSLEAQCWTLEARTRVFWLNRSSGAMWDCYLEANDWSSLLSASSSLTTYDTAVDGPVVCLDPTSRLVQHWSHSLRCYNAWSGEPVAGADVTATSRGARVETREVPLNGTGESGPFWLLGRELTFMEDAWLGPWDLALDLPGLFGEASAPGNATWTGVIQLKDVADPSVEILAPEGGAVLDDHMVRLSAVYNDTGSGIASVSFQLREGGPWEDLEDPGTSWDQVLELEDGTHVLTLMVTDASGRTVDDRVRFSVDTVPPLVWTEWPEGGEMLDSSHVVVRGRVDGGDDGSRVVRVEVNDLTATVGSHGRFEVAVDLNMEGSNTIRVRAWDEAGNRGDHEVTVFVDTMAPDLEVEEPPSRTNGPVLAVRGTCYDISEVGLTVGTATTTVGPLGTFRHELELREGVNTFAVIAIDAAGNQAQRFFEVELDTQVLHEVVEPLPTQVVPRGPVSVRLLTDPLAEARVVGHTGWVGASGGGVLELTLELDPDTEDSVKVEFRDDLGNTASVDIDLNWMEEDGPADADGGGARVDMLLVGSVALLAAVIGAAVLLARGAGSRGSG